MKHPCRANRRGRGSAASDEALLMEGRYGEVPGFADQGAAIGRAEKDAWPSVPDPVWRRWRSAPLTEEPLLDVLEYPEMGYHT
jgi:hypothetical protein